MVSKCRSRSTSIWREVSSDAGRSCDAGKLTNKLAWDAVSPVHCLPQEALARGAGAEYSVHVHLSCEAYAALSAPLTEIVVWTLREGASRARVEELLAALVAVVSAIPFSKGMYGAGWGPVVDDERTFVVLIGWSSMEVRSQHHLPRAFARLISHAQAFQLALQNSSDGKVLLMELDKFAERQLRHVVLRQSQERPLYEARL